MQATIIKGEVCGKCKFSRPAEGVPQPGVELVCKRFPPTVASILAGRHPNGAPQFINHTTYPSVGEHEEGCGEWKVVIRLAH